ncbi:MAG TPA: hypothetical protein VFA06_18950 [Actinocrinis sp.]|jgi:hypothetical protein|uniref:hypothetical protein n=1 Tax=Actinocrinis sp. TaxID=1920516 RepID=UPI002D4089BC|nr:hypothetical protein [Actinocrinis sp.]HZU57960.1 hypothetical protein [Actinocrinis sp.]
MKASRSRPTSGYERAWTVFGIVVAVLMALAGLSVAAVAVVFWIGMSHYGSNK